MDLNTILQDCFTKHQAFNKLEELREEWKKENFDGRKWNIEDSTLKVEGRKIDNQIYLPSSTTKKPSSILHHPSSNDLSIIQSMESLVIFTAFPLPAEQIPILGNFVRITFPQIKFIDLKVDPALAGGASVSWKGEYRNYSLRQRIINNQLPINQ